MVQTRWFGLMIGKSEVCSWRQTRIFGFCKRWVTLILTTELLMEYQVGLCLWFEYGNQ